MFKQGCAHLTRHRFAFVKVVTRTSPEFKLGRCFQTLQNILHSAAIKQNKTSHFAGMFANLVICL